MVVAGWQSTIGGKGFMRVASEMQELPQVHPQKRSNLSA